MGAWVTGHNLAGYLPESDPYSYAEHSDAVAGYEAGARHYADQDDEQHDEVAEPDWADEDYGSMRATVDSILRDGDDRATPATEERGMVVEDSRGRLISFWLTWDDEAEPDL